jgi:hypothetical protein
MTLFGWACPQTGTTWRCSLLIGARRACKSFFDVVEQGWLAVDVEKQNIWCLMWSRSRPPSGARKMVERLESPGSWLGSIETGIIDLDVRGEFADLSATAAGDRQPFQGEMSRQGKPSWLSMPSRNRCILLK